MKNDIDPNYFKGTPTQARIVAMYNLFTIGENRLGYYPDDKKIIEIIASTCGDTHVHVLDETPALLVYESKDSRITVITAINKADFSKSTSIEY